MVRLAGAGGGCRLERNSAKGANVSETKLRGGCLCGGVQYGIGGEPVRAGATGVPVLVNAPAAIECRVAEIVKRGDHHIVVAEVVEAAVAKAPDGRPDEAVLHMKDLGANVFYGG